MVQPFGVSLSFRVDVAVLGVSLRKADNIVTAFWTPLTGFLRVLGNVAEEDLEAVYLVFSFLYLVFFSDAVSSFAAARAVVAVLGAAVGVGFFF